MLRDPVTVVVPCYNEESSVEQVLAEVSSTLRSAGQEYELIVVNDGSTDRSGEILRASRWPHRVISHRGNRGYGASIKAGIRAASHGRVLIMDSDGQHPPENILLLLDEAEDYDMVVGARRAQGSHRWRLPGKLVLKLLCEWLVGRRIPDINSGFRLIRTEAARRYMHLCSDQFSFSTSITLALLSDRLAVKFVPIDVRPRRGGRSQVRVRTGFSTFMLILRIIGTFNPLPIFMPPSVVLFVMGMGVTVRELILRHNISDAGVICLLGSLFLFCFGLLADQMALLRREISKS